MGISMALKTLEKTLRERFPNYKRLVFFNRFLARVSIKGKDECWEWLGRVDDEGRGLFDWQAEDIMLASMASYTFFVGPIPRRNGRRLCVCHSCDNPLCVNPFHLWIGTQKQNIHDMMAKGRENMYYDRRGERNPKAKLDQRIVEYIRSEHRRGHRSLSELARRFNVSVSAVWDIVHEHHWQSKEIQ
jgi:hypothetical protein